MDGVAQFSKYGIPHQLSKMAAEHTANYGVHRVVEQPRQDTYYICSPTNTVMCMLHERTESPPPQLSFSGRSERKLHEEDLGGRVLREGLVRVRVRVRVRVWVRVTIRARVRVRVRVRVG